VARTGAKGDQVTHNLILCRIIRRLKAQYPIREPPKNHPQPIDFRLKALKAQALLGTAFPPPLRPLTY